MSTSDLKDKLNKKMQTERTVVDMPETGLATLDSEYIALQSNAMEIISENLKNRPLSRQSIDMIKSPGGGSVVFTVPSIAGDEILKELTGVILDYATPRAYWDSADPVEGTPPTCYSLDSVVSHDGKPCNRCVHNEFGSKGGGETNAKACKEFVELYMLRPGNIMPIIVRVPVSSKLMFDRYLTRLVSTTIPLCGVITKITLEKATSKGGKPYAKYNFEAINTLSPVETSNLRAFSRKVMESLSSVENQELREVI